MRASGPEPTPGDGHLTRGPPRVGPLVSRVRGIVSVGSVNRTQQSLILKNCGRLIVPLAVPLKVLRQSTTIYTVYVISSATPEPILIIWPAVGDVRESPLTAVMILSATHVYL